MRDVLAIEVTDVVRRFAAPGGVGTRDGARRPRSSRVDAEPGGVVALDRVSLSVPTGARVAVVGPSGCGKSTLLRVVAGLDRPDAGAVLVGGAGPDRARAAKQIGWMAQQPALLPWRTVRDNVRLAQTVNPRPERRMRDPDELLATVGLLDFADAYPTTLSGGMQQRAALARLLATDAPVWLMDEPFAALDELTREALADDLLAIWASERPTIVWVTHHVPEAVRLADRLVIMTARPGTVSAMVEVGLAHPRDESSPAFQDVVRQARTILRGSSRTPDLAGAAKVGLAAGAAC